MVQDWLFQTDEGTCHFRCAGVLIQNGKVLLQRDGEEYALPGGHVQMGETGEEAVVREFQEELGISIRCRRMLWSEECFWKWKGRLTHTVSFYYLAEPLENSELADEGKFWQMRDSARIEMGWVPVERLEGLTVYPDFLKQQIHELSPGHFVTRDA